MAVGKDKIIKVIFFQSWKASHVSSITRRGVTFISEVTQVQWLVTQKFT